MPETKPLLSVVNLHTEFIDHDGNINPAVNGVTFNIFLGETVALVGESGSGKSMTALSIMGLIPPPGKVSGGEIIFGNKILSDYSASEMRYIRGSHIAMIFQEPMTSLNPVLQIGDQVMEPLLLHRKLSKNEAMAEATKLLQKVGIPSPEKRLFDYPHQLSGGMRQRVMIAMALACSPNLLIADEPTTALDVTIQAQILELLDRLRGEKAMSILLITHDFGVVAERADTTCVMYAGKIVEMAKTSEIIENPLHPYTKGLLASLPELSTPGEPLKTIKGQPTQASTSIGCNFFDRCPLAEDICTEKTPEMNEISTEHFVRCWKCNA